MNTEIDTMLRTWIPADEPGVAVALLKEGQIVHCQGYGLANMEWGEPVTLQTVFAFGSITKPFTATAIMLLEKQGKLHLDDAIQTYLPEYPTHGHHGLARWMSHVVLDLPAPIRQSVSLNPEVPCKVIGIYQSVYGTIEVKEEERTLYLCEKTRHALVPMGEMSFYYTNDEDVEVSFEKKNEQGHYTRIRVIRTFLWFTAEG